jgi:hypothetical protein
VGAGPSSHSATRRFPRLGLGISRYLREYPPSGGGRFPSECLDCGYGKHAETDHSGHLLLPHL